MQVGNAASTDHVYSLFRCAEGTGMKGLGMRGCHRPLHSGGVADAWKHQAKECIIAAVASGQMVMGWPNDPSKKHE